ncbi:unnamed protein product [Victoria cruziana]
MVVAQQVPCCFIFGDSLSDSGNNNHLPTLARADYRPYGIDFPQGPTGRFSNGLIVPDVAAELLGFQDPVPPYSQATPQMLLKGANFASAAAGIREETGRLLGARVTLRGQVQDFHNAAKVIAEITGSEDSAAEHLSKCIFTVAMGANDYLNNYFMPGLYPSGTLYAPEQYAAELVRGYARHLTALYQEGARKVAIFGIGPVGCTPSALSRFSDDGTTCVEVINDAVRGFNSLLPPLVDHLNRFEGAHFTYINVYAMFNDIHDDPTKYGIRITNVGCCGVGRNNGQKTCVPYEKPCPDRREYLFWNAFHPTEAVSIIVGKRCFDAEKSSDAYPIDIRGLAQI